MRYVAPDGVIDGELTLKRQFGIENGELASIFDVDRSSAEIEPYKTSLYFGDVKIVENGEPLDIDAQAARKPMLEKELVITVDLALGSSSATAFTCDFSYDYIKINAEYHT